MWKEILLYLAIILVIYIFVKLGRFKWFNRKVLSLWQRIVVSLGFTLILIVLFVFGSLFFVLLFVFLLIMVIIAFLFGGRFRWKKF